MKRPKIEVLEPESVEQIVAEAIGVLGNPGVRVHNDAALDLLEGAGAQVDRITGIASLPQALIEEQLKTVPSDFYLYDMAGDPAVPRVDASREKPADSGKGKAACMKVVSASPASFIGRMR